MKRILFAVLPWLLALQGCISPQRVHGQFIGYMSSQSVGAQRLFNAQATTATSAIVTNLGQSSHSLMYCYSSNFAGTIDLEGSPDSTNWAVLASANYTDTGTAQCHVLQAGAFYNLIRSVTTIATGTISAWYTATGAPINSVASGVASIGPIPPVVCDHTFTTDILDSASALVAGPGFDSVSTTAATVLCGFTISFAAPPSAGSVQLVWGASTSVCSTISASSGWKLTTASTTPQTVIVPILMGSGFFVGGAQTACFKNGSGQTITVNGSYARIHVQ